MTAQKLGERANKNMGFLNGKLQRKKDMKPIIAKHTPVNLPIRHEKRTAEEIALDEHYQKLTTSEKKQVNQLFGEQRYKRLRFHRDGHINQLIEQYGDSVDIPALADRFAITENEIKTRMSRFDGDKGLPAVIKAELKAKREALAHKTIEVYEKADHEVTRQIDHVNGSNDKFIPIEEIETPQGITTKNVSREILMRDLHKERLDLSKKAGEAVQLHVGKPDEADQADFELHVKANAQFMDVFSKVLGNNEANDAGN